MSQIQAVMLIIEKKGKFLLGKRASWKPKAPGYWCPISGKIEFGETEETAVTREALEEVGLVVRPLRNVASIDSRDGTVRLHFWKTQIISGEARITNDEHSEIGWFSPEELRRLSPSFEEDLEILLRG